MLTVTDKTNNEHTNISDKNAKKLFTIIECCETKTGGLKIETFLYHGATPGKEEKIINIGN